MTKLRIVTASIENIDEIIRRWENNTDILKEFDGNFERGQLSIMLESVLLTIRNNIDTRDLIMNAGEIIMCFYYLYTNIDNKKLLTLEKFFNSYVLIIPQIESIRQCLRDAQNINPVEFITTETLSVNRSMLKHFLNDEDIVQCMDQEVASVKERFGIK